MNNSFKIEGERIFLRLCNKKDAAAVAAVASSPDVYEATYNLPRNFTKRYARRWITQQNKNFKKGVSLEAGVFLKSSGEYIGHCAVNCIYRPCKSGNLFYFINNTHRGRGYATEAARLITDYAFNTLSLNRITGLCMERNAASRRVLEKTGMVYEGCATAEIIKDGVPVNILHFAKLK